MYRKNNHKCEKHDVVYNLRRFFVTKTDMTMLLVDIVFCLVERSKNAKKRGAV